MALAGCLTAAGCIVPITVQTRYAGDLSGCATGPGARATLVRIGDHFSFAPADGVLVISGTVAPDGGFSGSLVTNSARHDPQSRPGTEPPPFTVTVTGHLDDEAAAGTYVTPRCTATFHLPHIGASVLP